MSGLVDGKILENVQNHNTQFLTSILIGLREEGEMEKFSPEQRKFVLLKKILLKHSSERLRPEDMSMIRNFLLDKEKN